jgi:hypothetical protein
MHRLDGAWHSLLAKYPEWAQHCSDWHNISDKQWTELLKYQPQLARYRPQTKGAPDG